MSGSLKESGQGKRSKGDHDEDATPPYTPLIPEQWQAKMTEIAEYKVIKYRRIFQTAFYLC